MDPLFPQQLEHIDKKKDFSIDLIRQVMSANDKIGLNVILLHIE